MPVAPLLDQVGGEAGIVAILDDLYTRMFDDPLVGFLFEGKDKEHIVRVQAVFTRRLLGDTTARYEGKSMPEAHAELPILPGHFDRRHFLLAQVLAEHRVPDEARETWLRLDQALRTSVLKVGQARADQLNARPSDEPER